MKEKLASYDWQKIADELDQFGTATLDQLFSKDQCSEIVGLYDASDAFRSTISMARHGFGRGEYKYFANPLPEIIGASRKELYGRLSPIANRWSERLRSAMEYPSNHDEYLAMCHAAGQTRPTPLILQYVEGDYNCLHQDLYGDLAFPLQVAVLLSQPGENFMGGEFVLTEQRPRMQSRAEVVPLRRGDAVIFAVNDRPICGTRGDYKAKMRHGVSRLRSGKRHTLGIIFHDAR